CGTLGLAVAVEFYLLDTELAGHDSYVPALVCLVAVSPKQVLPFAIHVLSALRVHDAGFFAGNEGIERDGDPDACEDELVVTCVNDQTASWLSRPSRDVSRFVDNATGARWRRSVFKAPSHLVF